MSADSLVSSFSKQVDKFSSLASMTLKDLQQSLHTDCSYLSFSCSFAPLEQAAALARFLEANDSSVSLLRLECFSLSRSVIQDLEWRSLYGFSYLEASFSTPRWLGIFKVVGLFVHPPPASALKGPLVAGPFELRTFAGSCLDEQESFEDNEDFSAMSGWTFEKQLCLSFLEKRNSCKKNQNRYL